MVVSDMRIHMKSAFICKVASSSADSDNGHIHHGRAVKIVHADAHPSF